MLVRLKVWVFVVSLLPAASIAVARGDGDAPLVADGWQVLSVPGQAPAIFAAGPDAGEIEVRTNGSVGFLYRPVTAFESTGALKWRWRVDKSGPHTDQSEKGGDDRPLAVHLWFPAREDDWSLTDWFYDLFGVPVVGHALTYVWGGRAEVGTSFANPHLPPGRGVITIAAGGPDAGDWRTQHIDYGADFARHFGRPAPAPEYLAISGDTDDVGGMSVARISGLRFVSPAGETQ